MRIGLYYILATITNWNTVKVYNIVNCFRNISILLFIHLHLIDGKTIKNYQNKLHFGVELSVLRLQQII